MKSLSDMPAVRTPEASQDTRHDVSWASAFPFGGQGRLLRWLL